MNGMFGECCKLDFLDLSNFDTSNVRNMLKMFALCHNLKEIRGINNFITINVKDMSLMFAFCHKLEYLDLSNFNTKNVVNMFKMFIKRRFRSFTYLFRII